MLLTCYFFILLPPSRIINFHSQQLSSFCSTAETPFIVADAQKTTSLDQPFFPIANAPTRSAPPPLRQYHCPVAPTMLSHSATPIDARPHNGQRRRGRRFVSPTPFVLHHALVPSAAQQQHHHHQQQQHDVEFQEPLGPSKRKLRMSPFATSTENAGNSSRRVGVRRVIRRRVSISGRRSSSGDTGDTGTVSFPRQRSLLGPSSAVDAPHFVSAMPVLRTAIASSSP